MHPVDINTLAGTWKALLVSPDRGLIGDLMALLTQQVPRLAVFEMQSYPSRQVLLQLAGPQAPNICFLDLSADRDRALSLVGELLSLEPKMNIVVLLGSKDPELILRSMRQGAVEFLVRPFTGADLTQVLERIAVLTGGTQNLGRIHCVIPAKGACGASTIACNLAPQWKRFGFKRILLADLDPLTGTQSFLLKMRSNYSFLDALSRASSMDADIWRGLVTTISGLDVILAPETVQEGCHSLRDASSLLQFARQNYDVVIIDTASAYGPWNVSIARNADEVLVVTTNELPALQAAQRSLAYLESNQISLKKIRLLLNRYSKEHGLSKEVIESALHTDVYQIVPSDAESVQRALLEGKTIPSNTTFGRSLFQLAEHLSGLQAVAPKKGSSLTGMITSLFSKNGKKA